MKLLVMREFPYSPVESAPFLLRQPQPLPSLSWFTSSCTYHLITVLSGIYDTSVAPEVPIISEHATQGSSLKIANRRCHYNLRKYSFSMRITKSGTAYRSLSLLPLSVNSFKNKLDKHWALQELKYDWEAELSGTGRRSRVEF